MARPAEPMTATMLDIGTPIRFMAERTMIAFNIKVIQLNRNDAALSSMFFLCLADFFSLRVSKFTTLNPIIRSASASINLYPTDTENSAIEFTSCDKKLFRITRPFCFV